MDGMNFQKMCRVCKEMKDYIEFGKSLAKDGRQTVCLECKENAIKHKKEGKRKCRKCGEIKEISEFNDKRSIGEQTCLKCVYDYEFVYKLRYYYGLTLSTYNHLISGQGGRCAICGENTRKLLRV